MLLLLGFAFLAGLATILAPCIWPVLPIVLSSSIAGKGHRRPLGITLGVILSFAFFTLFTSYLVRIFHLDPNLLRLIAVVVIAFLGLSMIIPALSAQFELAVSRLSNLFNNNNQQQSTGFLPGFITGLTLGIVWSPCAGPILATIAALAVTEQVNLNVIFVTLAYITGIGIPLFIFAYAGQRFIVKAKSLSAYTGKIQKIFGVITILAAIAIYTNYDQTLQLQLIDQFPALGTAVNGFENSNLVKNQLNTLKGKVSTVSTDTSGLFNANTPAPDFAGATGWLNTPKPISINDLKGKVILVDFWTYTCINCIRTLPFVTKWYDKYHDQGFVVIGAHTPEFTFEKETGNVLSAIKRYNIHYPVPQDNNYAIWNNFNNSYWPAEYLIDAKGNIRRTHFGEGEYDQMEMAIQALLKEAGHKVANKLETLPDQTPSGNISPETYLNSTRMQYYYPSGSLSNGKQTFTLLDNPPLNTFTLGGDWTIDSDNAVTGKNATLNYHFTAGKVFLVLRPGTAGSQAKVKVFLDGKVLDNSNKGNDVNKGEVVVDSDRLYNLIDLQGNSGEHILKLEFESSGIEAFAFTFG